MLCDNEAYNCPPALANEFSNQELDEFRDLFTSIDEDGSGAVSSKELGLIFEKIGEEVTEERLAEIVVEVDADRSGEVEFGEFLTLMAKFKKAEGAFGNAAALVEKLGSTPMTLLRREAGKRDMGVRYAMKELRPATSAAPASYVFGVYLTGEWCELKGGMTVTRTVEEREFQGVGRSTRDAKFSAATFALSKLKEFLPGLAYDEGTIPPKWMKWFLENFESGVDCQQLLNILFIKGFHPAKNKTFMQLISAQLSMNALQSDLGLKAIEKGRYLPPEWMKWAQDNMSRGVEGTVVLEVLVKQGFRPEKNPHLMQLIRANRGGGATNPARRQAEGFFQCACEGDAEEMVRYLSAGQDPNGVALVAGENKTALTIACGYGHFDATKVLLERGASGHAQDRFGRTPLHHAAAGGNVCIVEYLVVLGVDIHIPDKYGDTALHIAASHGNVRCADWLMSWQEERLRRYLSGKDIVHGITFDAAVRRIFRRMMRERLSPYAIQRFPRNWLMDASMRLHKEAAQGALAPAAAPNEGSKLRLERERQQLPNPPWGRIPYVIDFVEHVDPKLLCSLPKPTLLATLQIVDAYGPPNVPVIFKKKGAPAHEPPQILEPELDEDMCVDLIARILRSVHCNVQNNVGRTALHNAVDPANVVIRTAHRDVMQNLMDDHGADLEICDNCGHPPEYYLITGVDPDKNDLDYAEACPPDCDCVKCVALHADLQADLLGIVEAKAPLRLENQASVEDTKQGPALDSDSDSDTELVVGPIRGGQNRGRRFAIDAGSHHFAEDGGGGGTSAQDGNYDATRGEEDLGGTGISYEGKNDGGEGKLQSPGADGQNADSGQLEAKEGDDSAGGIVRQARVLYDFDANGPTELSVPEGAVVDVLEEADADFWKCSHEGSEGLVQSDYLEEITKEAKTADSNVVGNAVVAQWTEEYDEETSATYYYNHETEESVFDDPRPALLAAAANKDEGDAGAHGSDYGVVEGAGEGGEGGEGGVDGDEAEEEESETEEEKDFNVNDNAEQRYWKLMRRRATVVQQTETGEWQELKDPISTATLFFNTVTRQIEWVRPYELMDQTKPKQKSDLVALRSELRAAAKAWEEIPPGNGVFQPRWYNGKTDVETAEKPEVLVELDAVEEEISEMTMAEEAVAQAEAERLEEAAALNRADAPGTMPESDVEWREYRRKSDVFACAPPWTKYVIKEGDRRVVHYYNDSTNHSQLEMPHVFEREAVPSQAVWDMMRHKAFTLRLVDRWQELLLPASGKIFYHEIVLLDYQWDKPPGIAAIDMVEAAAARAKEESDPLFGFTGVNHVEARHHLRVQGGGWATIAGRKTVKLESAEMRWWIMHDEKTLQRFYFNPFLRQGSWDKPDCILRKPSDMSPEAEAEELIRQGIALATGQQSWGRRAVKTLALTREPLPTLTMAERYPTASYVHIDSRMMVEEDCDWGLIPIHAREGPVVRCAFASPQCSTMCSVSNKALRCSICKKVYCLNHVQRQTHGISASGALGCVPSRDALASLIQSASSEENPMPTPPTWFKFQPLGDAEWRILYQNGRVVRRFRDVFSVLGHVVELEEEAEKQRKRKRKKKRKKRKKGDPPPVGSILERAFAEGRDDRLVVDRWVELRDVVAQAQFYYHPETGEGSWTMPRTLKPVELAARRLCAGNVNKHYDEGKGGVDWAERRQEGEVLRRAGAWVEVCVGTAASTGVDDDVSKVVKEAKEKKEAKEAKEGKQVRNKGKDDELCRVVFYFNEVTSSGQWEVPEPLSAQEKTRRTTAFLCLEGASGNIDDPASADLRLTSKVLRDEEGILEIQDPQTGAVCYYTQEGVDPITGLAVTAGCQWFKPADVLECDRAAAGWLKMLVKSTIERSIGHWEQRYDGLTKASFFRNTKTGQCQWEVPDELPSEDGEPGVADMTVGDYELLMETGRESRRFNEGASPYVEYRHIETAIVSYHSLLDAGETKAASEAAAANEPALQKPPTLLSTELRREALLRINELGDDEWAAINAASTHIRRVGPWEERRHGGTGALIYLDPASGELAFAMPMLVRERDQRTRGIGLCDLQTGPEWYTMRERSEACRKVDTWVELRQSDSAALFYFDKAAPEARAFTWEKPYAFVEHDAILISSMEQGRPNVKGIAQTLKQRARIRAKKADLAKEGDGGGDGDGDGDGDALDSDSNDPALELPVPTKEQWAVLITMSDMLRSTTIGPGLDGPVNRIPEVQEYRHSLTGVTFYRDTGTGECSVAKLIALIDVDRTARGMELGRVYAQAQWDVVLESTEFVRRVGEDPVHAQWDELIDRHHTKSLIYHNRVTGNNVFEMPQDAKREDMMEHGMLLIRAMTPVQWKIVEDRGAAQRIIAGWKEVLDLDTQNTFYMQVDGPGREWEKPAVVIAKEIKLQRAWMKKRGWALVRENSAQDWEDLRVQSCLLRTFKVGPAVQLWSYLGMGAIPGAADDATMDVAPETPPDALEKTEFTEAGDADEETKDGTNKAGGNGGPSKMSFVVWFEYRHPGIGVLFYFSPQHTHAVWQKPAMVRFEEAMRTGWARMRRLSQPMQVSGVWEEHWHTLPLTAADRRKTVALRRISTQMEAAGGATLNQEHDQEHEHDHDEGAEDLEDEGVQRRRAARTRLFFFNKTTGESVWERPAAWDLHTNIAWVRLHQLRGSRQRRAQRDRIGYAEAQRAGVVRQSDTQKFYMNLFIDTAKERQKDGYTLCQWGCKDWIHPSIKKVHLTEQCPKRLEPCPLKCGLVLRIEFWDQVRKTHLGEECPKRSVECPRHCGENVVWDVLQKHMDTACVKRPVPPIECRLGCGKIFAGGNDRLLQMREEREDHEREVCDLRVVRCNWVDDQGMRCMSDFMAKYRSEHRRQHLEDLGIKSFRVAGLHTWEVPPKVKVLKMEAWGGGGGSGHLLDSNSGGGDGAGSGFVEIIIEVKPGEKLEIVVASGGAAGIRGTMVTDLTEMREAVYNPGIAPGGEPGGGNGTGGNKAWAAGGGGGYSAVFRNGPWGKETLMVAGGGGGGGSRPGLPGGGLTGGQNLNDPRNGAGGTQVRGGAGGRPSEGESMGNLPKEQIQGTDGKQWMGGHGCKFGGGGGGGVFGGGGGGSTPGIAGAGGGGSSFACDNADSFLTLPGNKMEPGGNDRDCPLAVGVGDWDLVGGMVGLGGTGDARHTAAGNPGAVRLRMPGFY
jgi:hypothetical protein